MPDLDEFYMAGALAMARRGLGSTSPNPTVGAVLVDPNNGCRILSRGVTRPGGRPHAERVAFEGAQEAVDGATLYVTLEPCSHHGKTPPCVEAIIEAGIARVVCAMEDPDPRVAGAGFSRLKDAGIAVTTGVLADEAYRIVQGHILRTTQNRPLVQIKLATGSDGRIPQGHAGQPVWATGPVARNHGHLLRVRSDVIVSGRKTVDIDDPELTCRLPGLEQQSPTRLIISAKGYINSGAKVFAAESGPPVIVAVSQEHLTQAENALSGTNAELLALPSDPTGEGVDIGSLLNELAESGVTRVLVEGGPTVIESFVVSGNVDQIFHYVAPTPVGAHGIAPFGGRTIAQIAEKLSLTVVRVHRLGDDRLHCYA